MLVPIINQSLSTKQMHAQSFQQKLWMLYWCIRNKNNTETSLTNFILGLFTANFKQAFTC